ncbi:MAG: Uma2 family endonuclease [Oscillatoriales cyanobacterium SM2_1_8]|nr:Uma2 family endonuclease [Oscillatoriales cyanobacterium SM2_1_8]
MTLASAWPDHRHLPDTDGTFVQNFQEHPQSLLLTDSLQTVLATLHPDGRYAIGQDSGIYWRLTDPPENGVVAPDWYYVPNVPPLLNGERRRSYVLWQEQVIPPVVLEFVSGDGREERDATPPTARTKPGKFWVYEQALQVPYYGIYDVEKARIDVYERMGDRYRLRIPDGEGRVWLPPLGVFVGIWWGPFLNQTLPWVRWWDAQGELLPTGHERAERAEGLVVQEYRRAEQEKQRAEQEKQRAEQEKQRADRLAAQLRALGISPEP